MQSDINIKVGNKPPKDYFEVVKKQMLNGNQQISGLSNQQQLFENLKMNCVSTEIRMNFIFKIPAIAKTRTVVRVMKL